jgi:ABC-type Fe3+-hydroxamate transport system substrate-binding protein
MTVRDQMGFELDIEAKPQRIISLVPSQTELLFDLGLEDRIVGVTKFCVHPDKAKTKTIVGGTKNFQFDVIKELRPDLIIGNKEENYKEGISTLRASYPVWMSDIVSVEDALNMIHLVGEITFMRDGSNAIINSIKAEFKSIHSFPPVRSLYLIWKKPWMAAGTGTFIHSLMDTIGLINCIEHQRYPELTNADIMRLLPELILLSSEPYPFKEIHVRELQSLVPSAKIILTDGEIFSWYGSRLIKAPAYFNSLRNQLA